MKNMNMRVQLIKVVGTIQDMFRGNHVRLKFKALYRILSQNW